MGWGGPVYLWAAMLLARGRATRLQNDGGQIPDTSFRPSLDRLPPLDEDSHSSHPPHPFYLAPSLHRQPAGPSNDSYAQPSPPGLAPLSPGLRKSFSVDSFARHSRASPVSVTSRQPKPGHSPAIVDEQHRASPSPWQPQAVESPQVSYLPRDPSFPLSGRSRGASVSTVGDDNPPLIPEEPDPEAVLDAPQLPAAAKRASTKIKAKARPSLPPGELPLPSKLHSTSAASPASAGNGNDSVSRLPAIPGATTTRRPSKAGPSTRHGHAEDTAASPNDVTPASATSGSRPQTVTLVVIGGRGCGKSSAISRGLKHYKLSDPLAVISDAQDDPPFRYVIREGKITDERGRDGILNVLEVDTAVLQARLQSGSRVWPEQASTLDGVIACCDVSRSDSFVEVEGSLVAFREARLPIVALVCKNDLESVLDLKAVHARLTEQLDIGLVSVSVTNETGKRQLRLAFDWVLKAIGRTRRTSYLDGLYQNPASPDVLTTPPPWDIPRSDTATPIAAMYGTSDTSRVPSAHDPHSVARVSGSSTRTRSTGDLLPSGQETIRDRTLEQEISQGIEELEASGDGSTVSLQADLSQAELSGLNGVTNPTDDVVEGRAGPPEKDSRYGPWSTLDDLFEKLLFLTVSGDDWGFISHFLLTYRRFASPRSVVLALQKRMRQLDQASDDPMFTCFAQMRICQLVEVWIQDYPHDFAVGGAADALNALVKSILTKTHLLHYGTDLLPFLEGRPLEDRDSAWALKVVEPTVESEDPYSFSEDDEEAATIAETVTTTDASPQEESNSTQSHPPSARERKHSLPLNVRLNGPIAPDNPEGVKDILRNLLNATSKLNSFEVVAIAEQITRVGKRRFLQIEPRDWLQHVFVSGKKNSETDTIAAFNGVSEHLADWVVSLILCHDKAKNRAKQIEKLVEIAEKLRGLNNYSALRAFVAGINNATYPGDPAIAKFQESNSKAHKHLQSWDLLFNSTGSHRSYRMALRNSKGACIPALEVHLSDLIRAHVGNGDFHADDPTKIHWAKFNMMGRFVHLIKHYQTRCRDADDDHLVEDRPDIIAVLSVTVMDSEMQLSRIAPPPEIEESNATPYFPRTMSREHSDRPKDAAIIRKLMFWV
ncbi:ras guanine nucleotide exchange factor domain-containing protein [Gloeopeniophorella convolvens]|nr:ras guanine nucleotide exchange factor domain-containing protein [Gloeopeniophorella convolvens]